MEPSAPNGARWVNWCHNVFLVMIILVAFAIFGLIAYGSSVDGLTQCNAEFDVVNGTVCGRTQDYLRIHNPTMLNITYPGQLFQFTITNWNPFFTAEIPLCYKATLNLVAPFETCPQGYIELLLKNITYGTTKYYWCDSGKIFNEFSDVEVATAFPTHRIEYETFVGFPEIPPLMWIDFGMIDTFSFCTNSRKEYYDKSINFGKSFVSGYLFNNYYPAIVTAFAYLKDLLGFQGTC